MLIKQLSLLSVTALCLMLVACQPDANLSDMDWVLGKWQINDSNNFEEWAAVNGGSFQGKSYQVRGNENVIGETMEIIRKDGAIYYIPTVLDQNEGKPVAFKLVSISAIEMVFENEEHDFPQRIVYVKNGDRQIDARIEGERDGQLSKVDFMLQKVD